MASENLFKKRIFSGAFSATCLISLVGAVSTQPVFAQPSGYFNQANPVTIEGLPPGLLRSKLISLPAPAKSRALKWLQGFDFPAADAAYLRADNRGGVFYEDPVHTHITHIDEITGESAVPSVAEINTSNIFKLHSKPGASKAVYLDMDGHVVTGTIWNSESGYSSHDMLAYDLDGDPDTFNDTEIAHIAETWKRIAEDYAPYDIDVTTEMPAFFGPNTGHILISPKVDKNGNTIYSCNCGGVAYVNVWARSNYTYYQPALVFPEGSGSDAKGMAEAATHELGHNLGLSHDATPTTGYYDGHGSDNTSWAPIMGVGYYRNVTQWSKGEYANANNTQDDLAIIDDYLGYGGDDHEDTDFSLATSLVRSDSVTILATNPVNDPDNINSNNKGIIGDRYDVDLFYIDVNDGIIDLTVTPVWVDNFVSGYQRSANLDVKATLLDAGGNDIDQDDPANDTFARVTATVGAGRYILAVEGVGVRSPSDGYSDYASIGQYFINGTVPTDIVYSEAPTAPGDLAAILTGDNNIELSWTDPVSLPETNEAAYRVYRQLNGGSWSEIATIAQDSSFYADNNLSNGSYVYYLEAYNGIGFDTSNSTDAITISLPVYAYATSESTSTGTIVSGSYLNTQDSAGNEVLEETHQGGRPSRRISSLDHSWNVTDIEAGSQVRLAVEAEAIANSDGDDFEFTYSINGGSSVNLGVIKSGDGPQTLEATLPTETSGSLELRVVDTDRSAGNYSKDRISVYQIVVSSSGNPADLPPVVSINEPVDGFSTEQAILFTLSASASDAEDGDISSSVKWSSDRDGVLHTGASFVANTFDAPLSVGAHQISASATDSAGNNGQDSITVTITAQNEAPTAAFNSASSGLTANFTDASTDSDGSVVSWSWDFGDGNTSTVQNPSHSYAAGGTYTVTLTVTDDDGAADSTTQPVTVNDPPANVAPTAAFSSSTIDLTANFTDLSTDSDGSVVSWFWDFGDSNGSTLHNPSHTYAAAGTYTVTLTVTDDDGAADSTSQDVTLTESGNISLIANGYKIKGVKTVDLTWSGASGSSIDVLRQGYDNSTTNNDGEETLNGLGKGGGSDTFQVCEQGTSICSNEVIVTW